jgi:putative endopeptidase
MNKTIIFGISAIVLGACASGDMATEKNNKEVAQTAEKAKEKAEDIVVSTRNFETVNLDYMDREVRPQDDFFSFANGNWVKNNPVPPSESRWGSFNELDQENKKKLTTILEKLSNKDNSFIKGKDEQILGDYYASLVDMEKRNALGVKPIEDDLKAIDAIISKNQIPKLVAQLHSRGIGALFSFGVGQNLKAVDKHTVYMGQGGIGLPNKDYYTEDNKQEIRDKYVAHIEKCMNRLSKDDATAKRISENAMKVELVLSEKMMTPAERRHPELTYNKFYVDSVKKMTGSFDFEQYLSSTGIESFKVIIISQPKFVASLPEWVDKIELTSWKDYFKWCVVNHYAGHLDQEFVDLNFEFYGKVLSGKQELKPINERAINEITGMEIGELLGRKFVENYYSQKAQDRVNEMVDNLLAVFESRINGLDWMSAGTKSEAILKLNAIGRKLGFPNKWNSFKMVDIQRGDYIANRDALAKHAHEKNLKKLNEDVDKDEWGMPAHMVNAYYHPLLNEIAFPAGIMQPPFFSESYEDAVNYGRIGMVIGHEFTHGFDDMGSKFAADGSFKNWWQDTDRGLFEERTATLGRTYDKFCPIDGHCVNSQLTMGENIADLGGLTLAFHAYEMTDEYKSGIERNGFTPAQRFFIAYAQLWKINYTDEELKKRVATDPHSPGMYRVNGPLKNCPEFFEAFDVKEEDAMRNPDEEVAKIW